METVKENFLAAKDTVEGIGEQFSENLQKRRDEADREQRIEDIKQSTEGIVNTVAETAVDIQDNVSQAMQKGQDLLGPAKDSSKQTGAYDVNISNDV